MINPKTPVAFLTITDDEFREIYKDSPEILEEALKANKQMRKFAKVAGIKYFDNREEYTTWYDKFLEESDKQNH